MDVNSGQMDAWEAWAIAGSQVIRTGAMAYGVASDIAGGGLGAQETATGLSMIWEGGVRTMGSVYDAYQGTQAPRNVQTPQPQPWVPGAPGAAGSRKDEGSSTGLLLMFGVAYLAFGGK